MKMKKFLSLFLALLLVVGCIPTTAFAATDADSTITVETISAAAGGIVDVDISIANNPGIAGATFKISYHEDLTLVSAANGTAFADLDYTQPGTFSNPCNFTWDSENTEATSDGVFLTLSFQVAEDATENEKLNVDISYRPGDVFSSEADLNFNIINGNVVVLDYMPGDVFEDGVINAKDTRIIRQYITGGYDIEINEAAADVNADGVINAKDTRRIRRHITGGYPDAEVLLPSPPKCPHTEMEATDAKAVTCEKDGNHAYWYCPDCEKYFSDEYGYSVISLEDTVIKSTGHTVVVDPAKEPTKTETGLTEGSHCSVCKKVIVAQEVLPVLTGYAITYNIATGDSSSYIAAQGLESMITDEKRQYFSDEGLKELPELSLDGYQFLGWYTAPPENSNAVQVNEIKTGSVGNYTLYAHWHEYTYDITYKLYQTPLGAITNEDYLHYTVSKGQVDLPNPELYNYVFLGWYTDEGKEVTKITAGTTGDLTLNAYWTSKRNLTKSVKTLEDPIVIENSDDGVIYFTYELGTIENVPLSDAIWTIQSVAGLAQQKSETVSTTISEEKASAIANTISSTTVDSATWTLSNNWNDVTEVSEEWAEQNEMTQEEANTKTKSSSGTYSFTSSNGGSNTITTTDGTTTVDYNSQNKTHGNSAEFNAKISGSYSNKGNLASKVAGTYEVSAEVSGGYEQHQETNEHTGTDTTTVDTTVDAGTTSWNNASTSSSTKSASESVTVKNAMSQIISNKKGYGKSYSAGGENSESQGFSSTDSQSANSSSTLTYFTSETKTTTTTYSTDGKSEGCYRLVVAGTVHVFGVVGYDVATKSYFAYTYNVLDDKTYEFLDYSPTLSFNDYENGAIPFEVPYFVHEYVSEKTVMTSGLSFKTNTTNGTATVVGYTGTDADVTIPSYFTSGNVAYKVTGLSASAFAGKNVQSVILSDYITVLPDGAFKGCTQLEEVSGYYTKIGSEAFSGCTALKKYNVTASITEIGENAFAGVDEIYVTALDEEHAIEAALAQDPKLEGEELLEAARKITQEVVDSAVNSGARNIVLDISKIIASTVLTLNVPEIESFTLQGGLKEYDDLKLSSAASETTIKEITIHNCTQIPLEISSDTLKLDAASIEGTGFVLLLNAPAPKISLSRDSRLISIEKEAVVWSNPTVVSEVVDNAVGTLDITGNVYVYGDITGVDYMSVIDGDIIPISAEEFENYIKGVYKITFDANGGQVGTTEMTVFYGSAFGELPTPTLDYHTFDGWFTEDGTEVTANSVMTEAKDIKLTAHWTQNDASGWVLASNVPADAEIVNQKWSYNLKTNITSSSNSVAGYTLYDSSWVWGSYGPWSEWSKTAVSSSDSRQVETRTVTDRAGYTNYRYYVWRTSDGWGYGTQNYYTGSKHGSCTVYDEINLSYALSVYDSSLGTYGPYNSSKFSHSGDSYWFSGGSWWVAPVTHTEWRYRDRSKVYTYYHTKTEAKESYTEVKASDTISNVQKWVQYRAK